MSSLNIKYKALPLHKRVAIIVVGYAVGWVIGRLAVLFLSGGVVVNTAKGQLSVQVKSHNFGLAAEPGGFWVWFPGGHRVITSKGIIGHVGDRLYYGK